MTSQLVLELLNTAWAPAIVAGFLSVLLANSLRRRGERRRDRLDKLLYAHTEMARLRWTVVPDAKDGGPQDRMAVFFQRLTDEVKVIFEQARPALSESARSVVDAASSHVDSAEGQLDAVGGQRPVNPDRIEEQSANLHQAQKTYREAVENVIQEAYREAIAADTNRSTHGFPSMPWLRRLLRRRR